MSTASTDALYATIRTRILTWPDPTDHVTVQALVSDLYRISAPDTASGVYGVMMLGLQKIVDGAEGIKETAQLEVMLFGRPRKSQAIVEGIGDRVVGALTGWRDGSSGLLYTTDARAQSMPAFNAPADRELVQVRVTATLKMFPVFLTRLSA